MLQIFSVDNFHHDHDTDDEMTGERLTRNESNFYIPSSVTSL